MILALDTSGRTAGAAIVDRHVTLGEVTVDTRGKMTHSEILLPMIDRLFDFTGLALQDMDYIACVCGPGSFTGLRIGAATAQGLARGAGKPLIGVPTLDAMAYNIGYAARPETDALIAAPMLDARRKQVYTAFYACGSVPKRLTDYSALPVAKAVRQIVEMLPSQGRIIFLGDGADAYADELRNAPFDYTFAPANANRQRAASAGVCAWRLIDEGHAERVFSLTYIRRPQAERERFPLAEDTITEGTAAVGGGA